MGGGSEGYSAGADGATGVSADGDSYADYGEVG